MRSPVRTDTLRQLQERHAVATGVCKAQEGVVWVGSQLHVVLRLEALDQTELSKTSTRLLLLKAPMKLLPLNTAPALLMINVFPLPLLPMSNSVELLQTEPAPVTNTMLLVPWVPLPTIAE